MRNIAESDFENFIPLSIQEEGGSPQFFSLSLPAMVLWENEEGFLAYAESRIKDMPRWERYSNFLHRLKENGWKAVPFEIDETNNVGQHHEDRLANFNNATADFLESIKALI